MSLSLTKSSWTILMAIRIRRNQPLSSNTFEKGYMADGVKRIPVTERKIRGTLSLRRVMDLFL
ncbi:hypothetical protein pdam_00019249, partial [Pocillopora damicornis]